MNKVIKSTLAVAASAVTLASTMAPSLVSAWGDNSSTGLRDGYTIRQINDGILGNDIVFNSIIPDSSTDDPMLNPVIGDERNFVGARENTGINAGVENVWNEDQITVENGKTYLVRLYVHNNSPLGEGAIAEDVNVGFALPELNTYAKHHQINGFINAPTAAITEYWDYVNFVSDTAFKLTYVPGSAKIENNSYASLPNGGAKQLSDDIIYGENYAGGVKIGYEQATDGKIPGCFQYASYITIEVKAEYPDFMVEKQARIVGTKEWSHEINAKVGDQVEFQIQYKNTDDEKKMHNDVMIKDSLPKNLRYVPGTIKLYNASYPEGVVADGENLFDQGINIGSYGYKSNGYIRFTVEVVDESLECGSNALVNWGLGGVGDDTLSDYATVMLNKVCEDKPTPELPKTGPETITGAIVTAGVTVTVAGYYIASRRSLR